MIEDKTFMIVSHNLEQLKKLSNKIYYLEKGSIVDSIHILDK